MQLNCNVNLRPGCFAQKKSDGSWTDGAGFWHEPIWGFCEAPLQAAPSLRELAKAGRLCTISRVTGEKLAGGRNRREWLGAIIFLDFLNADGKYTREILAKIRNENPEIGAMMGSGDELIEAEILGEQDFTGREIDPRKVVFLLSKSAAEPDDRALWWKPRRGTSSAPAAKDNLPF